MRYTGGPGSPGDGQAPTKPGHSPAKHVLVVQYRVRWTTCAWRGVTDTTIRTLGQVEMLIER